MNKPTQKQMRFLSWEFGVFFHFGIRTFYEGHRDWDGLEMPLSGFLPEKLDCLSWIKTIKQAGAKYAVLTCKHHDGFANWPSNYTEYSVKNTPWKDGKGDVVREYVDACRSADIKVGLYYSPADKDLKAGRTAREHDDFFINQVSELLTNYGKIDYLWFDGCGSEGHTYDTVRIIKVMRTLQPELLIFGMWDPDTTWVGNEDGYAHFNNFSVYPNKREGDSDKTPVFYPNECDFRIRLHNWFYSDYDTDTIKSVEELMGIYDCSVGRGANFLINIGPDRRGRLPDPDTSRILEFGQALKQRFANPVPCQGEEKKEIYTLNLPQRTLVKTLVIEEQIEDGQSIEGFEVYAYVFSNKIKMYIGETVGYKAIVNFPPVMTQKICVEITKKNFEKDRYFKKVTGY